MPAEQIKTKAEALDTGFLTMDRIQQRTFESAIRTIISCNPREPKQAT